MKKLFSLILVLGLALVLVACGNKKSNTSTTTSTTKTESSTSANSMDGEYYLYEDNVMWALHYVKVDGKRLNSKEYGYLTIDTSEGLLKGDEGEFSFDFKDDTFYIDDEEYVKVDSKKFKKLQQNGVKVDRG